MAHGWKQLKMRMILTIDISIVCLAEIQNICIVCVSCLFTFV